jgi:hypothetical protein
MSDRHPFAPVRFPRKAICDRCGNPFETLGDDLTCTQCMIKPSRRPTDFPPVPKEMIMPQPAIRQPKICIDCHNTYTPTGACQKRCPKCAAKKPVTKPKAEHPFGADVPRAKKPPVIPARPGLNAQIASLQDAVSVFRSIADAGCTSLVFGNTRITVEAL